MSEELKSCPFCGSEDVEEIPERCKTCYAAKSCGGNNPRLKNGWKDCPFPLNPVEIGPVSINPYQFEGFWDHAMNHGRRTVRGRVNGRHRAAERMEPAARGFESSPGAPWNRDEEPTCGRCSHLLDGCCDYGICELEFADAFDAAFAKEPMAAWEAAKWARDWIVDNYKDEQADTCKRFDRAF